MAIVIDDARLPESKKLVAKEIMAKWAKINDLKRVVRYKKQINKMLEEVDYDVAKINREIFSAVRKKNNWVERYTWPITAWNSFCLFGIQNRPDLFSEENMIKRVKALPQAVLPPSISDEISKIIDSHFVFSTAAKLKSRSQEVIMASFKVFYNYVIKEEPGRTISKLADFVERDVLNFRNSLMQTQLSPLTGQKVAFNTLIGHISNLKRIYKIGYDQGKLSDDILKNIKAKYHRTNKREFCLSKEQVEKLRVINAEELNNKSLLEQFELVRNATMLSVQYEAALRADEVVNLCWENLPKYERTRTNIGPVIVIGAKQRPEDFEDRVYILYDRLDIDLAKWKTISDEFCKKHNMIPSEKSINGKTYHPIFFSAKGKTLGSETYISSIFASLLKKAGIILPLGYKSHIIRHSRITHWIDDGYPFEKVHENARHSDLSMTWRYFHSNAQKRIEAVEKVEKLDKESRELRMSVLPPKGALRSMIEQIFGYLKNNKDILNTEELDTINLLEIEKNIVKKCNDYVESKFYYTFRDVVDKWGLGRTQTYERINILAKEGLIKPILDKSGTQRYSKEEIDYLTTLVDSRKASIAFGYKEKTPTTIPGLANKGIIRSTKIGKLHHFEPGELVEHFFDKNAPHPSSKPICH
ncbi:MAG: site-specific integrase [Elusimicrobia bacterium]|nr:site-specific integrase [Candidatus Liberimonas magnetica]